jgi:hypothetical protein
MNKAICCAAALAVSLGTGSAVHAGGGSAGHKHPSQPSGHAGPASCHLNVDITKEAERQAGGADYAGNTNLQKESLMRPVA